ncbi:MAG: ABC transporter permease [Bacteroidales bacterium]|nr:ABC transporter permease [Bacteroidales bacterium]
MLKYFFKIALRYLWQKRTYSLLIYLCLTFGLTCAIITLLYIRNVYSYDRFHKNYDRIYSVEAWVTYFNGDRFPKEYLSASLSDLLKEAAPEAQEITRTAAQDFTFITGDKAFTGTGLYADSNFFSVFTFPLVSPGKTNILTGPNSILVSESMAVRFFQSTDCEGKTLIVKENGKEKSFNIAGIFKDVPRQSLLQFDFVIPFSGFLSENTRATDPGSTANQTWIVLKDNAEKLYVENKIRDLIKDEETTLNQELFLFPLKEKILYSYAGGKRVWNEMQNIAIAGSIGFAILLIACFNYINLSIALNFRRYREAGIKKAAGAGRSSVAIQYLGETFILTAISLLSSLILVMALLPGLNAILSFDIHFSPDPVIIGILIAVALFTGLVSGLLPALYLASSNPVDALKGKLITSHSYSFFRQTLIVFQFTIPVVLIICMMIIRAQDSYMRNYDLGVDRDRTIILNTTTNIQKHAESVKADLLAIPGIDAVSFTNCIPGRGAKVSGEVSWNGKDITEQILFWCVNSDFDYNKTVTVNIADGRFFDPAFSTDSVSYLINDIAAGVIKNTNPVGSTITVEGQKGTVIGVFKDFHAIDLAGPLVPTIMRIKPDEQPTILVKYSSGSFLTVSNKIREVYHAYETEEPYRAILFRDLISYSNLNLPSQLVGLAFIIALILACMGLFGLASFTSENRTKEIGIRKANGATTLSVMRLLLTNYCKWLLISVLMAVPLALMIGRIFLGRFFFHTPVPVWAFVSGPLLAILVALLTVSSQTWNVASRNPVRSLRYE